ncbi:MAG: L,D-transpeptidase family protein [Methylococcales bacterium]
MNSIKKLLPRLCLSLQVRPVLAWVLLSSMLSGCQHFPSLFPEDSKVISPATGEQALIDKHEFTLAKDQALLGKLATMIVQENDTLPDIARHFGLGYNDISMANPGISPWTPVVGSQVLLPLQFILPDTPHMGITLNLANMRLFYYPKQTPDKVFTYPVGIGRDGWNTPTGLLKIISKTANPSWNVPESIQREHAQKGDVLPAVVRSGPNNPLGEYAMRLTVPRYLIHGTNKPYGIGMQVSHGCVQLYPENIEALFEKTSVGTPVQIIHQPYLTAWHENMLYLEANKPLQNAKRSKEQIIKQLRRVSAKQHAKVDWQKVERVIEQADGIPTPVLENSPDVSEIAKNALLLKHPERLNYQPIIEAIEADDWAIRVADFKDELKAQQLVTMLNHQGPIIPARKVLKDNEFQVIAGPFKNKAEVLAVAKRIRMDFELKAEPLKPGQILVN